MKRASKLSWSCVPGFLAGLLVTSTVAGAAVQVCNNGGTSCWVYQDGVLVYTLACAVGQTAVCHAELVNGMWHIWGECTGSGGGPN